MVEQIENDAATWHKKEMCTFIVNTQKSQKLTWSEAQSTMFLIWFEFNDPIIN